MAINLRYEDGKEGFAMSHAHNGDETKAEAMLAFAFGKEQQWQREYIAKLLAGIRP